MNKIKVIDLLNMISKGEEVPKLIKYDNEKYKITKVLLEDNNYYYNYINEDMECIFPVNTNRLNDELEILEEEKKIPEKLNLEQDKPGKQYYIRNEYGTKCGLTQHSRMIAETLNEVIDYLDYLKSKGE